MPAVSEIIYWTGMVAVAVNALTGVLETEGKRMDLVGAILVGLVAALGGGTLRDILANEVPLVMRPGTLYATASWAGALLLILLLELGAGEGAATAAAGVTVFVMGVAAIRFRLTLPIFSSKK
ncbi:MAG: TRIC cation channel family protein [Pseudomonadota bacterium]|jgi:uncharacterized membrane protein YeiH